MILARQQRRAAAASGAGRWHVLTVYRPFDQVDGHLPDVLAARRDELEVQVRPAPGDRGTELAARATGPAVTDGAVRRALREARSLLEVGEVLQPGGPTTEPTLLNQPLRAATSRGREGGLL
jgi:hypothetical protein